MLKNWFYISLINFFVAACLGTLLRFAFVEELSWMKFTYFLHAHSHVAMLGWVYLALYALLIHTFVPPEKSGRRIYRHLFWLTQLSVTGMLFTFPVQGYAFGSIFFSSFHVILSYLFVYHFVKDIKDTKTFSARFVRASLFFLVLSTLALWAMAVIMQQGWQGKPIYFSTVQFYLHFQFNGWFIFAIIGLFLRYLERKEIDLPQKLLQRFQVLLIISCLLTYVLAITWSTPVPALFWINSLGVTLQFAALVLFLRLIRTHYRAIRSSFQKPALLLLKIAFFSFVFKVLVQTAVVVPYIATVGYTIRNYVIGFLHLLLLGMVTHFLLGMTHAKGWLQTDGILCRMGLGLLSTGFILSELWLVLQGTLFWAAMGFLPFYYETLFAVSALMPAGIVLILISQKNKHLTPVSSSS